MASRRTKISLGAIYVLAIFASPLAAHRHVPKKAPPDSDGSPEVVWHDPGDAASLDLFFGAGGKQDAPDPNATYTFVREDMEGTSPKF